MLRDERAMPRCEACGTRGTAGAHERCGTPVRAGIEGPPAVLAMPGFAEPRVLGRGGFGTVFFARRESDRQPVAVKVATAGSPVAAEQLAREGDALAAVGAPTVPALHGRGVLSDGAPYLVLEHVAAPTLGDVLDRAQ